MINSRVCIIEVHTYQCFMRRFISFAAVYREFDINCLFLKAIDCNKLEYSVKHTQRTRYS